MKEIKSKGVKGFLLRTALPISILVIKRHGNVLMRVELTEKQEQALLRQFGSSSRGSAILQLTPKMVKASHLPIVVKKGDEYELRREIDKGFSFRVYKGNRKFYDYDISHYDLEIQILDNSAVFRGNKIDYSARVLGH